MKTVRLLVLALGVVVLGVGSSAVAGAAVAHHGKVTCHGGTIAAGTYKSLRVTGACTLVASGNVTVKHDIVVTSTGLFNAGTPANAAGRRRRDRQAPRRHGHRLLARHRVRGARRRRDPREPACPGRSGRDRPRHDDRGSASIRGGGRTEDCSVIAPFGAPYYSVMEDSTIHGSLVIRGLHTCWLGVIRDHVGGSVRLIGNRFGDPDADEVVTNVIGGNLDCFNNIAAPQVGDSTGAPNIVGGQKRGECAAL